jgi:predicted transcriptional regulator
VIYTADIRYRRTAVRILVDVDESQVRQLDRLARKRNQSRAALIRHAFAEYLKRCDSLDAADAFGLWGEGRIDGLAYQEKIRREW